MYGQSVSGILLPSKPVLSRNVINAVIVLPVLISYKGKIQQKYRIDEKIE
jgi:hypothetical protein